MRVKRGNVARKRRKKVLEITKGFQGPLSKLYRPAHQAMLHALSHAYRDRRRKKRDFRSLWIARIGGALEQLASGISYSKFMGQLSKNDVKLNRKVLSDIAANEPYSFRSIIEVINSPLLKVDFVKQEEKVANSD